MAEFCLISAAPFEVTPIVARWQVQCPALSVACYSCGIGAISAAKSARSLAELVRGKDVIFVGTCGVFTDEFKDPFLLTTNQVVWQPSCVRHELAYTVKGIDLPITLKKYETQLTKGLPVFTTVCSSTISLSPTPPLADSHAPYAENLELYSVVAELEQTAHSLSILLAATNAIGPDAHAQWLTNHHRAATLTPEWITNHLCGFDQP